MDKQEPDYYLFRAYALKSCVGLFPANYTSLYISIHTRRRGTIVTRSSNLLGLTNKNRTGIITVERTQIRLNLL